VNDSLNSLEALMTKAERLIESIQAQTAAINNLAASNEAMVDLLAQKADDSDDEEGLGYDLAGNRIL